MCKKLIFLTSFMMVLLPNLVTTVNAIDQRIVGWWKLDDGTGTVAMDSSANGQNGTLLNEPTWDSAGMQGGCLQFDGTNDRVNITGTWTIPQYTVSLWFKQDAAVTVQKDIFSLENQTVAVGAGGILMEVGTDGRLRFLHRAPFSGTGGAAMESLYTPAVTTGVWHHWAVVKTATDMISYVDGILAGTQANPNLFDTPGDTVTIGDIDSRQMRPWNGLIDDVRIYNAALSEAEIKQVMENMANVTASNPQPRNGETDVARDVTLSWTSGELADTHNVFFGTDFNDVNNATIASHDNVALTEGLDVNNFDPGSLEYGTTYYWRVDEVNAPSSPGSYKGQVWQFSVEPY
ncbi:MAG: LamG domain-containing protein, partial [Sedimentisphaerales bacterium]|nr:LamG domain-containing protein [Sedimentisphaerales bacterium]